MDKLHRGQRLRVTIESATIDGSGVARVDGQVVFVAGALPGETCEISVAHLGHNAVFADLVRVESPSPHRITPDCPYDRQCGGCALRHMDYEQELSIKRQHAENCLRRIGGQTIESVPITGADCLDGYRNKVQFPVQAQNGKPVAGFFSARTHTVIPVDHCRIQPDCADRIRAAVLVWMEKYSIRAYDERTHTGYIRHIYVRAGAVSGQILVCIVANAKTLPKSRQLVEAIRAAEPAVTTIVFSPNTKKGNTVLGADFIPLFGDGTITDTLCGLQFRLSAPAFYQVNHAQAERLYEKAVSYAGLTGAETVLDLYCGTGTITLCLARHARRAVGVEIVPQAIEDAKFNAAQNGMTNAEFHCMDAGAAAKMFAEQGTRPDVIVVDPPRKGVSRDVISAIAAMSPARVVYVSCDAATLARDVKLLTAEGYRLQNAEAVDLFPRCAHVETVCLLSKLQGKEHIEIEVKMDEMDLTSAESKATYEEIREYVLEHTGLKVSHLYIAQVKQKYGIIERENYNKPKSENAKQPQCPPEKEQAITEAFNYFGML